MEAIMKSKKEEVLEENVSVESFQKKQKEIEALLFTLEKQNIELENKDRKIGDLEKELAETKETFAVLQIKYNRLISGR